MDKNRAVVALIVIIFIVVTSMLYVIFVSRKNVTDVAKVQTPEDEYVFDIDNDDIDNVTDDNSEILNTETNSVDNAKLRKDNLVKNESQKIDMTKKMTITKKSPQTGPGFVAILFAIVLGLIFAGIIYKKQIKI